MSFATSYERAGRYSIGTRSNAFGRRLAIALGLLASDLLCFAAADGVLHLFTTPPAIALFRGRFSSDAHNTVVDLIVIIAMVFVVARYVVGDYSRRRLFWDGARATTAALAVSGGIYAIAVLLLGVGGLLPTLLVWFGLFFLLPSARQATRYLLGQAGLWHLPTAIIGTSETAEEVYPVLERQLSLGLDVRWIVPERPEKHLPKSLAALKAVIAPRENLVATLLSLKCRQVILVPDDRLNPNDIIDELIGADIAVSIVPSLRRLPLFGLSTSYFFGKDLLLLQVRNNLARLPQRILKRSMDIVGSVLLLAALSPVFAILALAIKAEDGGPVFFVQGRVGRGRRDFNCFKFRTMVSDAEAQLERWENDDPTLLASYREKNFKLPNDPRVTRIGCWLRRRSLDELPQLINVLFGYMSLVGPRPLLRRELPDYGAVITLYERVRPGITGLWQISGRSHTTFAERVSYDEWYIKNWTVWYDAVILLQTVWVLIRGEGAY